MSRKQVRRFVMYHPGLFVDRVMVFKMNQEHANINLKQLSRILVRYRKIKQSYYIVLKLNKISEKLKLNIDEILTLSRLYYFS